MVAAETGMVAAETGMVAAEAEAEAGMVVAEAGASAEVEPKSNRWATGPLRHRPAPTS